MARLSFGALYAPPPEICRPRYRDSSPPATIREGASEEGQKLAIPSSEETKIEDRTAGESDFDGPAAHVDEIARKAMLSEAMKTMRRDMMFSFSNAAAGVRLI